jgi:SAM-dependent methyltransferase
MSVTFFIDQGSAHLAAGGSAKGRLDVGCGTGALTEVILQHAQPHTVKGIDPSAEFVEHAKAHIRSSVASFEVGDAQSLPTGAKEFDVAVAGLVLNFVPQPSRAVAEMDRAVRPGGTVAAYVWDTAVALDRAALDLDEGRRFPICHPLRWPSCSRRPDCTQSKCGRLTFRPAFAISTITGRRSSEGRLRRLDMPCHCAKSDVVRFATEFGPTFPSRMTGPLTSLRVRGQFGASRPGRIADSVCVEP